MCYLEREHKMWVLNKMPPIANKVTQYAVIYKDNTTWEWLWMTDNMGEGSTPTLFANREVARSAVKLRRSYGYLLLEAHVVEVVMQDVGEPTAVD